MKIFSILFFLRISFSMCTAQIQQTSDSTNKKNTNLGNQSAPKSKSSSQSLYGLGGSGSPTGGGMGAAGKGAGSGSGSGSGPGAALDMAGWKWDSIPKLTGNTKESGRIRFKIKIDADGEIETIKVEEKTVSQSLVNFYEAELKRQLRFSNSNGKCATEGATGYITLIIR